MASPCISERFSRRGIGSLLLRRAYKMGGESDATYREAHSCSILNQYKSKEKFGFLWNGLRDMKLSDGTYIDSILMYQFVK
ncbi:MAG: hypothetical protein IPG99_16500 [Ignavibacteria bacterium]|nr:hypothetical protein [Ignavibacteria bacterium]